MRDVRKGAEAGEERAVLAYEMYAHSIRKYLGQYMIEMAGVMPSFLLPAWVRTVTA